tara:strand:+ start:1045 stop:1428 length:384 start_codon:yes stop_codon:yes gene_type:complete
MGLGVYKRPKNEKKITAKDIRTANRVLKKGRKFPKPQKGSAGYLTRKEFKSPYKGQKNTKEEKRDLDLVYDYGTKAQKAKSFGRVKKKTAPIPNVRRGGQMVKISRKDGGQVFDGNKFVMSFYELMK